MANGEFPAVPPGGLLPPRPALRGTRLPPVSIEAPVLRRRIAELISALPIVSLEEPPAPGRPDLTPSPVPRVSLVPPTGQIDRSLLPRPPVQEGRRVATIAPQRQVAAPTPAGPNGPQLQPAVSRVVPVRPTGAGAATVPPNRRLRRGSWVKDVRSSKREIALGLGIGLGLSVVVGRVGQAYLEQRGAAAFIATAPRAPAPLGVAMQELRPAPVPSAAPAVRTQLASKERASASTPQPPALARGESLDRKPSGSARDRRTRPAAPRHGSAAVPAAAVPAASDPVQQGEPPGTLPVSPSQSAGLGLELPL